MRGEPGLRQRLGWVMLPTWSAYALGGLALSLALALPWIARWQGLIEYEQARPQAPPTPPAEPQALRPEMIELPGGTFRMGSTEYEDEQPVHEVTVSRFQLCRTEVTQSQWRAVMGTEPSDCDYGCGDARPVQNVSWLDAIEYVNALTERENVVYPPGERMTLCYSRRGDDVTFEPGCTGYRLPTEAEWEYAARAGTHTQYSFGDDESRLGDYAWYDGNAGRKVHDVGTRKTNPWGFYDVHGNVWEWVWDWYAPEYPSDSQVDPTGPKTGDSRALRGGSFVSTAGHLRSAGRYWFGPGVSFRNVGLRCARGAPPASSD